MSKIRLLPPEISNKIAAGEVVERPVSVVKEFVENSLDAGAKNITVEIKNAGVSYIRVTDDGCGMASEDVDIAFLRHSTSKISSVEDLSKIRSLGFRGEALAAIASVSNIDLFTRRRGDSSGIFAKVQGGAVINKSEAGCNFGTSIIVKELFFNVPARLKFLKSNKTECSYIFDIAERLALSNPSVSFRLISDGRQKLFTQGDGGDLSVIYSVYGSDYSEFSAPVEYRDGNIYVHGFVGGPQLSRPNRSMQTVFLNSRYIKSKLVSDAVEEACRTKIMTSRYPFFVLHIELDSAMVDINVHPSKIQAKFLDENFVYNAVYFAVKNAFENSARSVNELCSNGAIIAPNSGDTARSSSGILRSTPVASAYSSLMQGESGVRLDTPLVTNIDSPAFEFTPPAKPSEELILPDSACIENELPTKSKLDSEVDSQLYYRSQEKDFKIIGQVFDSYILVEKAGNFIIIDQHACHERKFYEQLSAQNISSLNQLLLVPVTVVLSKTEAGLVENHIDDLLSVGFGVEFIGENAVIIRQIPSDIIYGDVKDAFLTILAEVNRGTHKPSFKEKLIERMSCRAAVKANRRLSEAEMQNLAEWAFSVKNAETCPHGRPIYHIFTKYDIEKIFKRV